MITTETHRSLSAYDFAHEGLKVAAIDIGTNSIHMIVARVSGASLEVVDREKDLVLLGQSVFCTGSLSADARHAVADVLRKNLKLVRRHGAHELLCFATSAFREAKNGGDVIAELDDELDLQVRLISPQEEARLIFIAVREALDITGQRTLVVDVGGGSVELVLSDRERQPVLLESLKLGCLRLAELFGSGSALSPKKRRTLESYVRAEIDAPLQEIMGLGVDQVVATSGTAQALANISRIRRGQGPLQIANGHVVSLSELQEVLDWLAKMPPNRRSSVKGLDEKREMTIVPGGVVLTLVLQALGQERLILCDWALREGMVLDHLEGHLPAVALREAHPDLRARSVIELARRFGCDTPHAYQVQRLALAIFDQIGGLANLTADDRTLLGYAALLHDIGGHISYERHDRHTAYIIRHSRLRGFSGPELLLLTVVAQFHRGKEPSGRNPAVATLCSADRKRARILSAILSVAESLDRSHYQAVSELKGKITRDVITFSLEGHLDAELELWAARRKLWRLSKAFGREVELVPVAPRAPRVIEVGGDDE
ncbi:MAG: Ppx/GppA family phosphatase [Candidatus Schekmanbacteria bacterium]|nr:Ppx/GppA family phosphatase [Candidatus Schekmanbacteria bacterium]